MALLGISLIMILAWAGLTHFCFPQKIVFKESLLQSSIATIFAVVVIGGLYYTDMKDFSIINGHITDKKSVKVSCSHSYDCFCYESCSGSGENRSCHEVCQTCYEHDYDVDWRVFSTVGTWNINRVNRQGTKMPPRWDAVVIGEPASNVVANINYIKAAPDSLFRDSDKSITQQFANLIPKYPKIFDYYRFNRIIELGVKYPEATELNNRLSLELRELGPAKQVNILVFFVNTPDPNYRYAIEREWLGGKKNDVIVLFGIDNDAKMLWTDIITFGRNSGNELLSIKLKDNITQLVNDEQFTSAEMLSNAIIRVVSTDFKRKEMKNFEYLKDDYSISMKALFWYIGLQLIILLGTTILFYHKDIFDDNNFRRY